jgi:hypothetical protein
MPAEDHLNGVQFEYHPPEMGNESHRIIARQENGGYAGHMLWSSKQVRNIDVAPAVQRQGVATGMWNEGQRLAAENSRIPAPKHSTQRTNEGDAWARSVGGRLPRRSMG